MDSPSKKPFLYVVRGVPSSGKSTFCRTQFPDAFHVENDMFHYRGGEYAYDRKNMPAALEFCAAAAKLAVEAGCDVVVSNTFTKKKFVDSYRKLVDGKDYDFAVFRMTGDFKTNVHRVPGAVLKSMRDGFEDYPDEIYVYPNADAADDPVQSAYIYTNARAGDRILVRRSLGEIADLDDFQGVSGAEKCAATVTDVVRGAYDYMNIHYTEDDTGFAGLITGGLVEKAPARKEPSGG